jgi:ribonuclease-3 family protein
LEELNGILASVRASWAVDDDASQLPSQMLAYIGDAFYNLHVRLKVLSSGPSTPVEIHRRTVAEVSAPAQAALLEILSPGLTGEEALVARRGRNIRSSRQSKAQGASHAHSTAFEALIGFLLVSGQYARLYELLDER